uniref:Uncharacterized protein n=1 Tax=Ralstonia solanacearum TaxID=305 RepID=A0A0S4VF78_RALSL|nr:protein of unknown function [Ralstonia solanacearum]
MYKRQTLTERHYRISGLFAFSGRISLHSYHRSLVVDDLPAFGGAPPDRCAPRCPGRLDQRIGQQIVVGCDGLAAQVARLPECVADMAVPGIEHAEHVAAAVALARCADFPEIVFGHPLEILAAGAVFRAVEDGFQPPQFLEHVEQGGIGIQVWFHAAASCESLKHSLPSRIAAPRMRGLGIPPMMLPSLAFREPFRCNVPPAPVCAPWCWGCRWPWPPVPPRSRSPSWMRWPCQSSRAPHRPTCRIF